jgi:dihydroorotase-like cyclic amidohydrolase
MEPGWQDAWSIPFGNPQLDHYVSALLTKVNEGYTTLENLVKTCSEMPAKVLGVYPRKGAVQVGSDADLTIIDLSLRQILSNNNIYTKVGWSPYDGFKTHGRPVMTIVRGKVVMRDGIVTAKPGWGQFISGVRR